MSPRHHVHDAAGDLWRPLQVTFSPTAIRLGADRREVRRAEGLAAVVELIQAGRPELELSDSAAGGVR